MINYKGELQDIINNAVEIATQMQHEYVMLEHMLLSLIQSKKFRAFLKDYGLDLENLEKDIVEYLDTLEKTSRVEAPKRTNSLERVFNRALTQVLFSGRAEILPLDVFLSISAENNSHEIGRAHV